MLVKQVVLLHLSQASGPPLPLLALDHLPAAISPSLPLTTTRQCSLEGDKQNVAEAVTATSWILSQWYVLKLFFNAGVQMNTLSGWDTSYSVFTK